MTSQKDSSIAVLQAYLEKKRGGQQPSIDRPEVVAHAYLSALSQHWPSQVDARVEKLLEETQSIQSGEASRWMTQRRISLRKIAISLEA